MARQTALNGIVQFGKFACGSCLISKDKLTMCIDKNITFHKSNKLCEFCATNNC